MSTGVADDHAAILAELSRRGMDMVRAVQAKAEQASCVSEMAEAALAFERVSRSVRMAIAMSMRLADQAAAQGRREQVQGLRDEIERRQLEEAVVDGKAKLVARRLEAQIAPQVDTGDLGLGLYPLRFQIREHVEREAWAEDFMTAPVEDCVTRIRAGLDLAVLAAPNAPSPDDDEDGPEEDDGGPYSFYLAGEDCPPLGPDGAYSSADIDAAIARLKARHRADARADTS